MPSGFNEMLSSIDDEELIEELRRYGEKNLPTLYQPGSIKKKSINYLNDQNRDIYLKKLNHYKAREKIEINPSKQYLKQSQQSILEHSLASNSKSIGSIKSKKANNNAYTFNENDDQYNYLNTVYDKDDDIIEISQNSNRTEYVLGNNAQTSPISMSDNTTRFDDDHLASNNTVYNIGPCRTSTQASFSLSSQTSLSKEDENQYSKVKDRIELDKTLSKYRSEINNILANSINKNRTIDLKSKYLSEDVIFTGAKNNLDLAKSMNDGRLMSTSSSISTAKTFYCPKPSKKDDNNILDSIKTTLFKNSNSTQNNKENPELDHNNESPYYYLSKIKGGRPSLKERNTLEGVESISTNLQKPVKIKKEENVNNLLSLITCFINNTLFPFITHLGLQISKILPYMVIIIFTIVLLQYLRMKFTSDTMFYSTDSDLNNKIPTSSLKFSQGSTSKKEHYYCGDIKDIKCSDTKVLLKELINYLQYKSGQIDCSSLSSSSSSLKSIILDDNYNDQKLRPSVDFIEKSVHLNQVIDYLFNKRGLLNHKMYESEAVDSLLKAISKNPHWQIRLLNESYSDTIDPNKVTYLLSELSSKSFMCRLRELAHFIYVRVILFVTILITIVFIYLIYLAFKKFHNEKDKAFYNLVTQVTSMVEKQYEFSLLDPINIKPYIAVSHIFDTLVDPSQRTSKKKLWNKVVKFIEDHESRIHLEIQEINGIETHVWKWNLTKHDPSLNKYTNKSNSEIAGIGLANSTMISNHDLTGKSFDSTAQTVSIKTNLNQLDIINSKESNNLNQASQSTNSPSNLVKNGWQGDAFNKSDKLVHSPTSCLKIRNMFDPISAENDSMFAIRIHNDILEKCSINNNGSIQNHQIINNKILHIACDKKSKEGCVYVKCTNNEAAGYVYQCLNGTWYNGKLLNVKFLRSDRYLERFPESINYNQPIKPIKL